MIDLIEESPILKDGDSLSNYGVKENTQEKYAKICIVYKNNHGEVQNVWLNTFKGDVLHFCDSSGEDYRIGPNKKLVDVYKRQLKRLFGNLQIFNEKGRRTKNMLNINPWNMVMIVINLLVLYAIFRKFLYKPVMNVIHRREELIQGQFDSCLLYTSRFHEVNSLEANRKNR